MLIVDILLSTLWYKSPMVYERKKQFSVNFQNPSLLTPYVWGFPTPGSPPVLCGHHLRVLQS